MEKMDEIFKLKKSITNVKECSDIIQTFLDGSEQVIDSLLNNTKVVADFSKRARTNHSLLTKPVHVGDLSHLLGNKEKDVCELHVNEFDSEQIWQGIEISNDPLLKAISSKINKFCKSGSRVSLLRDEGRLNTKEVLVGKKRKHHSEQQGSRRKDKHEISTNHELDIDLSSVLMKDDGASDSESVEQSDNIFHEQQNSTSYESMKNQVKKSVIDDGFFVLEDMNRFLDFEDKREMRKGNGNLEGSDLKDVDYFCEDFESDDDLNDEEFSNAYDSTSKSIGRSSKLTKKKIDAKTMMYADYFDEPVLQKSIASKNSVIEKNENETENLSVKIVAGNEEDEDSTDNEDKIANEKGDTIDFDDDDDDGDGDGDGDGELDIDIVDSNASGNNDVSIYDNHDEYANNNDSGDNLSEQNCLSENPKMKLVDGSSVKSRFEKESLKMQKKIKEIEAENVAQRPWQLTGEATAAKRPKNSLLEESLYFDQTLVAAPTVTEETTETLEQMIVQRIKDQAWDDVHRKVKPIEKPYEYKRSLNLDQEKSKLSLAEIYEKEYIKQTEEVEDEEKNPEHEVIEILMKKLFGKLDALSNFQFTPKQPQPEFKVISNLPSVAMEESTPITVSNEMMLAPEEVYNKKNNDMKGQGERTTTDKKRERRKKKIIKREVRKNKEQKLKEKEITNPRKVVNESRKAALETLRKNKGIAKIADVDRELGKSLKSSSAFFTHLQENISKNIKKSRENIVKTKKHNVEKVENYKL